MNRLSRRTIVLLTVLLIVDAAAATGQTVNRTQFFATGGILADLDPHTYSGGTDTTPGAVVGVGVTAPSRWSFRFEAVLPAWHKDTYNTTGFFPDSRVVATQTYSGDRQHRLSTYSFLAGYEFSVAKRLHVTPLIGVGSTQHADRGQSVVETRFVSGTMKTVPSSVDNKERLATITYGADFAIGVAPRVAIVPQVRFDSFTEYGGAPRFRPGVGVRFGF